MIANSLIVMIDYYFAYGSNMNPARMRARGIEFIRPLAARLIDFELRFNKRATGKQQVAYANIGYARGACVEGVLYQLQHGDDIYRMDPYEGNPVRYGREVYTVETIEGRIHCWVYVANQSMLAPGLLPERRYLDHLLAGSEFHSEAYRQWLLDHPCIEAAAGTEPSRDGLIFNV